MTKTARHAILTAVTISIANRGGFLKGQISLEALLLLALSLALLGIAFVAVNSVRNAQENTAHSALLSQAADALASTADEICVMGESNSRSLPMPKIALHIDAAGNGRTLVLSAFGKNASSEMMCPAEVRGGIINGKAYLWFDDSPALPGKMPKIIISNVSPVSQ